MLEQRHKMAMLQLEKEMQGEMQKQREILNRELEEELQHELSVSTAMVTVYKTLHSCNIFTLSKSASYSELPSLSFWQRIELQLFLKFLQNLTICRF